MATAFVSTGSLPAPPRVTDVVDEAHRRFRAERGGTVSPVYPALAEADPDHFGICVAGSRGETWAAGDAAVEFTLMSVSKPFVLALAAEAIGFDAVRRQVGVNATGLAFTPIEAVERRAGGRTNPMVNPGAITTTGLVPGGSLEERWEWIVDGMSRFAGRPLALDDRVYASAIESNHRNRALAHLLHDMGAMRSDPDETVELYTRQCSLAVDVRDLAVLGVTLASGGTNPVTGAQVVRPAVCHDVLAVMATAGMYETSGDWLVDVGLPGKSGISGAIVTVSPGKGGLGVYSPPLDGAGNSVRGQLVSTFLSEQLGLDLFASHPS